MMDFSTYDLRHWLVSGALSRHPTAKAQVKRARRTGPSAMSRMTAPLVAVGALATIAGATARQVAPAALASAVALHDGLPTEHGTGVYWIGMRNTAPTADSVVASFDAHIAALVAQVREGALTNVPHETLRLADAANARSARVDPENHADWVTTVAQHAARFNG